MQNQPKRFRLEIEGVRAIAAILVAVYHIWFNRVSGGVDVFFIMSGFLITTSLFSMYRKQDGIFIFQYIVKLLKRLMPSAWFIAIVTFIASYFLVSSHTRPQFFNELIASLFYFENWQLANDAVDYLAQNNEASPYQHYWALSIQFQFYVIWLLLFKSALFAKKAMSRLKFERLVLVILVIVSIASFIYSVYLTSVNQPVAYYHTFTRVWEFGLGGIISIIIHRIELPKVVAWLFGWLGLIGLLIGGVIFQVSTVFPGYAALWPTMSAVLILLAGNTSQKWSAYNLLASKPLVSFGKISYAFYLWHWPILILFFHYFDRGTVSLKAGLAIIALATILAYVTIYGIEQPLRKINTSFRLTVIRLSTIIALVGSGLWIYHVTVIPPPNVQALLTSDNPGALIYLSNDDYKTYNRDTLIPDLTTGQHDSSEVYRDGCFTIDGQIDFDLCEYGETKQYEKTIALIGGSHSAHWQPMLDQFGKDNNVRITTYLKGKCRFTLEDTSDHPECLDWFDNVIEHVLANPPDLVFTSGDISKFDGDTLPEGFVDAWKVFEEANVPLFLVRDTPWYPYRIPDCLREADGDWNEACKIPRSDIIREPSLLSTASTIPTNATVFDPTDYFCDDDYCYPIIGNVVTHFDSNHITASFSRSLAPIMEKPLKQALQMKS